VDEEEDDEHGYAHVIIPGAIFGIIAVTILIQQCAGDPFIKMYVM